MPKEITFYVFLGEKRDPSEIFANTNLRNKTHITQKPSYVYVRLINLKRRVFDLAGTKNSSWTDRPRKSGRFEIKRFQVLSTLISIKHAI